MWVEFINCLGVHSSIMVWHGIQYVRSGPILESAAWKDYGERGWVIRCRSWDHSHHGGSMGKVDEKRRLDFTTKMVGKIYISDGDKFRD